MELDPDIHIVMHSVLSLKLGVTVGSVGAGVAGVGLPALSRSSGEVRAVGGGGPVREGGVGKLGSTSRSRATRLEPRFGRRRRGKWGSRASSSGGANGAVVVVLGRV
jgi:hypothetical protein